MSQRCPGQDMRYWKPEDIFEVICPHCDNKIEFWKDEPMRICKSCQKEIRNPRIDLGCAKWCKYADQCLGSMPNIDAASNPVVEKILSLIESKWNITSKQIDELKFTQHYTENYLSNDKCDACVILAAAIFARLFINDNWPDISKDTLLKIRELLGQVNIADENIESICDITDALLAGRNIESLEFSIARKAVDNCREVES